MTKKGVKSYGFGFIPAVAQNHFFVVVPGALGGPVRVYERYRWTSGTAVRPVLRDAELGPDTNPVYRDGQRIEGADTLRLEMPPAKWAKVVPALASEFNARLKKGGLAPAKFPVGGTPLAADFGKEMMALLWAVKDADPGEIATAVKNWNGLRPEERCWLYTVTNERHGGLDDRSGWRAALRSALCTSAEHEPPPEDGVCMAEDDAPALSVDIPPRYAEKRRCLKRTFGDVGENGFYLELPHRGGNVSPTVYDGGSSVPSVRVPIYMWNELAHEVEDEFNARLKEEGRPAGKFGAGMNGLSRLFGKELTVLLWAVENVPKSAAPTALRNWKFLMPEERWWLYTQTAAAPRGWKKALGYALAERAAQSYVQGEMF